MKKKLFSYTIILLDIVVCNKSYGQACQLPYNAGVILTSSWTDTIGTDTANQRLQNYMLDFPITSNAFYIPIPELLSYIDSAINIDHVTNIQFILGENRSTSPITMELYIVGVKCDGYHSYIRTIINSTALLKCTTLSPHIALESPTTGNTSNDFINNYHDIPVISNGTYNAQAMTQAYINNMDLSIQNKTASSFLYNANDLQYYVNAAYTTSATNMQFILAIGYGKLTLVISPSNASNSSHIYMLDNRYGASVFDAAVPCPYCLNLYMYGYSLEKL